MAEKYDTIGIGYNTTRKADPYILSRLLLHLNPNPKGTYLDIGCGTGNYTSKLAEKGLQCIGIDPSIAMLTKAKLKNTSVDWKLGKVEKIDLPSASIDGIIASLTLHHWSDLNQGFSELSRVLKPKSNMVIFTATPDQMKGYWLYHYFPKMLEDSMKQMPSLDRIEKTLLTTGMHIKNMEPYEIKPDLQDLFLYSGKHDPKRYFDPKIRHGISSFSSIAHAEEVKKGLQHLENDINSGQIQSIIEAYQNPTGDYLFMTIRKD